MSNMIRVTTGKPRVHTYVFHYVFKQFFNPAGRRIEVTKILKQHKESETGTITGADNIRLDSFAGVTDTTDNIKFPSTNLKLKHFRVGNYPVINNQNEIIEYVLKLPSKI